MTFAFPAPQPSTWQGGLSAGEHSRFAPSVLLVLGLRIGFVVTGNRCRFDAEADVDLVHQDLDPAANYVDPFRLTGGVRIHVVEFAEKVIEHHKVELSLIGSSG